MSHFSRVPIATNPQTFHNPVALLFTYRVKNTISINQLIRHISPFAAAPTPPIITYMLQFSPQSRLNCSVIDRFRPRFRTIAIHPSVRAIDRCCSMNELRTLLLQWGPNGRTATALDVTVVVEKPNSSSLIRDHVMYDLNSHRHHIAQESSGPLSRRDSFLWVHLVACASKPIRLRLSPALVLGWCDGKSSGARSCLA